MIIHVLGGAALSAFGVGLQVAVVRRSRGVIKAREHMRRSAVFQGVGNVAGGTLLCIGFFFAGLMVSMGAQIFLFVGGWSFIAGVLVLTVTGVATGVTSYLETRADQQYRQRTGLPPGGRFRAKPETMAWIGGALTLAVMLILLFVSMFVSIWLVPTIATQGMSWITHQSSLVCVMCVLVAPPMAGAAVAWAWQRRKIRQDATDS